MILAYVILTMIINFYNLLHKLLIPFIDKTFKDFTLC